MNQENKNIKSSKKPLQTVFVGISGGVDSSVAAALLKKEGYNVVGAYMDLHAFKTNKSLPPDNVGLRGVKEICTSLNIPLKTYSLQAEFNRTVIQKFIEEYKQGNTPNPCVYCNKQFKFGQFFDKAMSDGADFVATGHYAQVRRINEEYQLVRGKDKNKDQSYFLYNLSQEILSHILFPIGHLEKTAVRKLAKEFNLPTAEKRESQDVCFIPNNDTQAFLKTNIDKSHGNIIDIDSGEIVGNHEGIAFYTIGQRRGVGIGGSDAPYFVVGKNIGKNELYVGKGENHPCLFKRIVYLENMHWMSGDEPNLPLDCEVSIRYRQKSEPATITYNPPDKWRLPSSEVEMSQSDRGDNGGYIIEFRNPVRAVSPGQSAVIYRGKICLGGGIIQSGE